MFFLFAWPWLHSCLSMKCRRCRTIGHIRCNFCPDFGSGAPSRLNQSPMRTTLIRYVKWRALLNPYGRWILHDHIVLQIMCYAMQSAPSAKTTTVVFSVGSFRIRCSGHAWFTAFGEILQSMSFELTNQCRKLSKAVPVTKIAKTLPCQLLSSIGSSHMG